MRRILLVLLLAVLTAGGFALPGRSMAQSPSKLGSVGLQVVPTSRGDLAVLQVPAGLPAAAAGMKPGDLIVQIDDYPLAGSDFAEVVAQRLWGVEGSVVIIHYLRPGEAGRNSVKLRRVAADPKLTVSPATQNSPANKGVKK